MNTRLHPRLITLMVLALTLAAMAACFPPTNLPTGSAPAAGGSGSGAGRGAGNSIEGVDWQLVTVGGTPAVSGSEATMLLEGGRATGTGGCNRYSGSYELSGANGIKFGQIASTQMACAAPIMAQEQAFMKALAAAASYTAPQDALTLKDASGAELATFKVRAQTSLTGTKWVAIGINNGKQAVQSVVLGSEVTAVFGADGSLSGKAGCNEYNAAYKVDGNKMTVQPPSSTRMFCAEPAGVMDQEVAYLTALQNVATYNIDGGRLELRSADGALQADFTAQP